MVDATWFSTAKGKKTRYLTLIVLETLSGGLNLHADCSAGNIVQKNAVCLQIFPKMVFLTVFSEKWFKWMGRGR